MTEETGAQVMRICQRAQNEMLSLISDGPQRCLSHINNDGAIRLYDV